MNLFWTNWQNKSILKGHKRGRSKSQDLRTGLSGALDIRTVSRSRQPNQWTPCVENNGGCSHLCLYRYNSYRCECPDVPDTRHCAAGTISGIGQMRCIHWYLEKVFFILLVIFDLVARNTGETQVVLRPTYSPDYFEQLAEEEESSESDFTSEHNSIARMVITATIIFGILLIIVVIAIICKFHSR